MTWFEFACIAIAATIFAYWSSRSMRCCDDIEETQRETALLIEDTEAWLAANR